MKYVIGLSFAALTLWILQATGAFMAIAIFLMIGVVPGTSITVPPTYVITLLSLLGIVFTYVAFRPRTIRAQKISEQVELAEEHANDTIDLANNATKSVAHYNFYRLLRKSAMIMRRAAKYIIHHASVASDASTTEACKVAKRVLPYLQKAASWLWVQTCYSVKGTMLSAHRWSSLSKKAWFSLTVWLKRCNSALKRGRSLLIRATR